MTKLSTPCLIAPGSRNANGYVNGYCRVRKKNVMKHVLACEAAHGRRPSRRHTVNHKCNNRACVNPDHIEWMTGKHQNKDAWARRVIRSPKRYDADTKRGVVDLYVLDNLTIGEISQRLSIPYQTVGSWVKAARHD